MLTSRADVTANIGIVTRGHGKVSPPRQHPLETRIWNGIIAEQMMKSCNNYDYDDADDYYDDGIINWPINSTHYEPEM